MYKGHNLCSKIKLVLSLQRTKTSVFLQKQQKAVYDDVISSDDVSTNYFFVITKTQSVWEK